MSAPVIGILAGMGPWSTAPFLDLVLKECRTQYGARHDVEFPPIQILSWPVPFYADRPTDEREVEAATVRGLERLAAAGPSFIGIACNTAHAFFPRLEAAVRVPLLDMVAIAADAAPGARRRLALVAARPTVESGIYQRALERRGHLVPELGWQDTVDALIHAVRAPDRDRQVPALWRRLAGRAEAAGSDGLVIACADLTAVRGALETTLPVLDATRQLAGALVRRWRRESDHPETGRTAPVAARGPAPWLMAG